MQPLHGAIAWSSRALRAPRSGGGASFGRGWAFAEDAGEKQKQIPFGNDNKKGKGKNKGSRGADD